MSKHSKRNRGRRPASAPQRSRKSADRLKTASPKRRVLDAIEEQNHLRSSFGPQILSSMDSYYAIPYISIHVFAQALKNDFIQGIYFLLLFTGQETWKIYQIKPTCSSWDWFQ